MTNVQTGGFGSRGLHVGPLEAAESGEIIAFALIADPARTFREVADGQEPTSRSGSGVRFILRAGRWPGCAQLADQLDDAKHNGADDHADHEVGQHAEHGAAHALWEDRLNREV